MAIVSAGYHPFEPWALRRLDASSTPARRQLDAGSTQLDTNSTLVVWDHALWRQAEARRHSTPLTRRYVRRFRRLLPPRYITPPMPVSSKQPLYTPQIGKIERCATLIKARVREGQKPYNYSTYGSAPPYVLL